MTLSICTAQLNFVVGDMPGNAQKIIAAAREAYAQGARLLLTPELAICGYAAEDLFLRPAFIAACDDAVKTVARETAGLKGLAIVLGHPQAMAPGAQAFSVCFNAASVVRDGKIEQTYAKRELPNYQVFDERRYFVPGGKPCVFDKEDEVVAIARKKVNEADGIIVGSPVYFAGPNGNLTAFMNRLFYSGSVNCIGKPAAAIVSARRAGTTATLDVLNKYFIIRGMPIVPSQYWCMVHGNSPEEVAQDKEGLQIMRTLGRNMAWLLKCIAAGKAAGITLPEREPRVSTNFVR